MQIANRRDIVSYIVAIPVGLLVSLAAIFFYVVHVNAAVAPNISNSVSFNQKAVFLKNVRSCDVLILGSSMGLNNLDGNLIKASFPDDAVVNGGSWGLTIDESRHVLHGLLQKCTPKIVILPTYYGDFTSAEGERTIDWNWFDDYLVNKGISLYTIEDLDLRYFAQTKVMLSTEPYRSNKYYSSLSFDATGGIQLADDDFHVNKNRWLGYNRFAAQKVNPQQLTAMRNLMKEVREMKAKLYVVRTPYTAEANKVFQQHGIEAFWAGIDQMARQEDATFVDAGKLDLPDDLFADFCHLKASGTTLLTRQVVSSMKASAGG